MIENGDFVRVDLTGRIKETGEIFETTHEDVANEAGVYDENKAYVPMPVVIGGGHFLDAIDQALVGMKDGESKHVEIQPKDGFGERSSQAIKMIPLKEFKKANINPVPGMPITIGYNEGKILTVDGGRIKVDFNHTFAGKTLEYDLHIVEVIDDDKEKVKSMIELHYPQQPKFDLEKTEVNIDGKTVIIKLDKVANYNNNQTQFAITQAKMRISKDIWVNMDIEKVEFVESFEKPPEEVVSEDDNETSTSEIPSSEEVE
ncbi:MAG: peptidylprolyl isomerase [Methanobrevibacter sp.]|jgi:peptidylprolyl isomerase/FKBP-type peptidyl-prolyl cis-trans isomerase SlyD|nr:peptidylprolyl isomerase [Candidatus Methanovirga australis]